MQEPLHLWPSVPLALSILVPGPPEVLEGVTKPSSLAWSWSRVWCNLGCASPALTSFPWEHFLNKSLAHQSPSLGLLLGNSESNHFVKLIVKHNVPSSPGFRSVSCSPEATIHSTFVLAFFPLCSFRSLNNVPILLLPDFSVLGISIDFPLWNMTDN